MVLLKSIEKLKKGEDAPSFYLQGIDNKFYSLEDFKGSKGLVIIFMCNHCPYVKAKISKIVELSQNYLPKAISFVGINPNNHPDYPEDSFENMKKFAKEHNIKFPYLFDSTQEVAKAYGAVCTPDPFVFDSNFKLFYHGRIDDVHYPNTQKPKSEDMIEVLDSLLAGRTYTKKAQPSMGCSIKWRE